MRRISHCHFAIKKVAQALAGEMYENIMSNNKVRAHWIAQNPEATEKQLLQRFVDRNWGKCLQAARCAMTAQLLDPTVPELQKEEIIEILALDQSLMRGRDREHIVLN